MTASANPSKTFLPILLVQSTLTQVITFVLRPTATYRAIELAVPTPWLGALSACFAIVPLALAVPSGQATDRFGERRVMIVGAMLISVASVLFVALGSTIVGLIAGTVVLGTGHLFIVVAQQTAVANTSGPGHFDSAFGYYTFAASLGQAVGPGLIILAGGTAAIPDTTAIFWAAVGIAVLMTASTVALRFPTRCGRPQFSGSGGMGTLLRLPGLLRALLISCVVLAAVDVSLVFLPALGADRGLASGFVGFLLVLRAIASMTTRVFLGGLARVVGRKLLMILSVALSAAAMVAVTIPMPPLLLAAVVVLLGLGLGVGQPLTMSWLAESAPAELRGRAMSLRLSGNRLGQVLIPSVVGVVAVGIGAAGVLWATACALGGAAIAARRFAPRPDTD